MPSKTILNVLFISAQISAPAFAQSQSGTEVKPETKIIYERLTGTPLNKANRNYKTVLELEKSKTDENGVLNIHDLSQALTKAPEFMDSKLRNFSSQFTLGDAEPKISLLDDLQTTILNFSVKGIDFRKILYSDQTYVGKVSGQDANSLRIPEYFIAQSFLSGNKIEFNEKIRKDIKGGIQATDRFSSLNFSGGTNRRPVKYILEKFLCSPISQWKDASMDKSMIRGDIDRAPGGNQGTFQTQCSACHAPMDAMAGAYARYDHNMQSNKSERLLNVVMKNLKSVYTKDSRIGGEPVEYNVPSKNEGWINLHGSSDYFKFRKVDIENLKVNWISPEDEENGKQYAQGNGLQSLGAHLANSEAFDECMSKKVFAEVCPETEFTKEIKTNLINELRKNNYQINSVFAKSATIPACQKPLKSMISNLREHLVHLRSLSLFSEVINDKEVDSGVADLIRTSWSAMSSRGQITEYFSPLTKRGLVKLSDLHCSVLATKLATKFPQKTDQEKLQAIQYVYQNVLGRDATQDETTSAMEDANPLHVSCLTTTSSLEFLKRN